MVQGQTAQKIFPFDEGDVMEAPGPLARPLFLWSEIGKPPTLSADVSYVWLLS